MSAISFDKDEYKAGETATITYVDAPSDGYIQIAAPDRTYPYTASKSGSGTVTWVIPADAPLGQYTVELWSRSFRFPLRDTMNVVSGGAQPTGFYDTGKVTPSTIEVEPTSGYYDVMFKLTGYKDKIITGVVIPEGATKTVSATLEPEVAPPVTPPVTPPTKGYLTVTTSPTGATVTANGVSCGTTPVTKCELDTGTKTVTFTKSGYDKATRTVTITAGAITNLDTITLTPTAAPPITPPVTKKAVTFKSVPSGASINIVSR